MKHREIFRFVVPLMIEVKPYALKLPINGRVGVLGAGVSGLSFAYYLSKLRPDVKITIFEKKQYSGGWIQTTRLNNNGAPLVIQKGPRTLRGISDGTLLILDTLINLGKKDQIMIMHSNSIANRKFLLNSNHELVPVPHSLSSFVKFLNSELSDGLFKSVFFEPFRKKGPLVDESIQEFFKRRFGSTNITDKVVSAIYHGIFAGDVAKLSMKSLFPGLQVKEQEHGSIILPMLQKSIKYAFNKSEREKLKIKQLPESLLMYEKLINPEANLVELSQQLKGHPIVALKDSLAYFPQLLTDTLKKNSNVEIVYGADITKVDPNTGILQCNDKSYEFDHIRSTINVHEFAKMVKSIQLKEHCNRIEYVSIFLVNIISKYPLVPKEYTGFGFLVPKASHNKEFLLGTIFDSKISKNVYPLGDKENTENEDECSITMMFGGHFYNSGIPSASISLRTVEKTLEKVFDIKSSNFNFIVRDESKNLEKIVTLNDKDVIISYNLHKDCIPQYNVGYSDISAKVSDILAHDYNNKVSIGGMCFGKGVGVPDCVINSLEDALKLS